MSALSIRNMNRTIGERELAGKAAPLTPDAEIAILEQQIAGQGLWLKHYTETGNEKAITNINALIAKCEARIAALQAAPVAAVDVAMPTPRICDIHGRIKGQWREPQPESSQEEVAHLARHGY